MFPANVCFFEDVLHVILIEIVPLYRKCVVRLRVVIDIMISTVPFELITGSGKLFNRLLPWIHYVPPIIILYTTLCISQDKYTKLHKIKSIY